MVNVFPATIVTLLAPTIFRLPLGVAVETSPDPKITLGCAVMLPVIFWALVATKDVPPALVAVNASVP